MTDPIAPAAPAPAAPASAAPAAPVSAAPAAPAAPTSWVDALPVEMKGFALNKGWDKEEKAVRSYIELEKIIGADKAGRTVVLPGEKATPEEIAAFHTKIGVPTDAAGYKIELPEDFPDPEFGKVAGPLMLKHGVPKAAGDALMADFVAQVQAGKKAQAEAEQAEFVKQEGALKTEWGPDFDKNVEIARRGMRKLGFTDEVIDQLETKAGFAGVIKAMHAAGVAVGEGKFVDAEGGAGSFGESHDHLMARRTALFKDPAWAQRFHANEPAARDEYRQLEDKIAAARKRTA